MAQKELRCNVAVFDAAYPPPVVGGKEKQAHLLAAELSRKGNKVQVLSFEMVPRQPCFFEGVPVSRHKRGVLGKIQLFWSLVRFRREFEVLHIHTPSRIGQIMLLLGKLLGYYIVFKLPNENLIDDCRGVRARFRLWGMLRADRIVVLEDRSARMLQELGVSEKRVVKMFNGVVLHDLVHSNDASFHGTLKLMYAGRLSTAKRVKDIICAVDKVRKLGRDVSLDILGAGDERAELGRICDDYQLNECVQFVGQVSEVGSWLRGAHALVLASEREGMPNIVLEAMSFGVPVIASNVGAVSEMLGVAGRSWTFVSGDSKALAKLIFRAEEDRDELRKYGERLYDRCKAQYSIAAVAEDYIRLYRQLALGTE